MVYLIEWVEQVNGTEEWASFNTPVGMLKVLLRGDVICASSWVLISSEESVESPLRLLSELELAYQANQPTLIKLLKQGTFFQHKVWAELLKIPCGNTRTYSEIAKQIDSAPRAVGNACRTNPYPWFIPCHRVVAIAGLGGYSGQTLGPLVVIKEALLSYELMTQV